MKTSTRVLTLIAAILLIPAMASTAVTTTEETKETPEKPATPYVSNQRQYTASAQLGVGPVTATIVSTPAEKGHAEATLSRALSTARAFDSEIVTVQEQLNGLSKGGSMELSPTVFAFMTKVKDLAAISHGWYDPTAPSNKDWFIKPDWRRMKLNSETRTITLRSDGMKFDLRRAAAGYVTDLIIDQIASDGFTNAMVETGPVHRNMGHDIFTPWNVVIGFGENATSTGTYRAYRYNIKDVAAATVTPSGLGQGLIDAHSKKPVKNDVVRSVTVFAADATTATAFAIGAYTLGPKHGLRYIESHPEMMCIMVDNDGALMASKNMQITNANERTDIRQTAASGGPNDLKQKKREESMEK